MKQLVDELRTHDSEWKENQLAEVFTSMTKESSQRPFTKSHLDKHEFNQDELFSCSCLHETRTSTWRTCPIENPLAWRLLSKFASILETCLTMGRYLETRPLKNLRWSETESTQMECDWQCFFTTLGRKRFYSSDWSLDSTSWTWSRFCSERRMWLFQEAFHSENQG